jgi:hypothetical protein
VPSNISELAALVAIGATVIASILRLARNIGDLDRRLAVIEALFREHCKGERTARRNTGEFSPITDEG